MLVKETVHGRLCKRRFKVGCSSFLSGVNNKPALGWNSSFSCSLVSDLYTNIRCNNTRVFIIKFSVVDLLLAVVGILNKICFCVFRNVVLKLGLFVRKLLSIVVLITSAADVSSLFGYFDMI